jgi:hypothetical protein
MSITIATCIAKLQSMIGDAGGEYADKYLDSINDACRETYPILHRKVIDDSLITTNIIPPFQWSSSSTLDFWTEPTGTLVKNTDPAYMRRTSPTARVIASGDDDSLVLDSDYYPNLLHLEGFTDITLSCWAYPQVANDVYLDIITTLAGADTTESSTTLAPALTWTKIQIEDYDIPDDITRIRINLRVHSTTKQAVFVEPKLPGLDIREYLLPQDLQNGEIKQVWLQTTGYNEDITDDIDPHYAEEVFGWNIVYDGSYAYLRLPYLVASPRRIRLVGYCPLENDADATTDKITIPDRYLLVLLNYAAFSVYEKMAGIVSGDARTRYQEESMKWLGKYEIISKNIRMPRIPGQIRWSI